MDNINAPFYNSYGMPISPNGQVSFSQFQQQPQYQQPMQIQQPQMIDVQTPTIIGGAKLFSKLTSDSSVGNLEMERDIPETTPKKSRKKKDEVSSTEIIKADSPAVTGIVEDTPTIYSYMQTTGMLHDTVGQIDGLNSDLMQEFNVVRQSRTMKNKYNTLIGLSENISSLISNRVQVIKEINATISKANDMDYKKDKDRRAATANLDDDKYIADLYKSFMSNPNSVPAITQAPQVDPSIFGSGIVRADLKAGANGAQQIDNGYLNFMSNLSPEQNLMRYEGNNNVKQVVVFDAASGNKFFQMMDMSTGQVIPNVPVYDQMFMEDTTLDLQKKIAKNINLNESFPIVVINDNVTSQY